MSRDHRKLSVFHQAHKLTLALYQHTRDCPREEWLVSGRRCVAPLCRCRATWLREMHEVASGTI